LSRWPFRRLPHDEPAALIAKLRAAGVEQAWAASFDSLFHKDLGSANARLAELCRTQGDGMLAPFGAVNPVLPDWEEELRRCLEQHRMPGIRLHPSYHGYPLDDGRFRKLLDLAAARGAIVQLALSMEDERVQLTRLPIPPIDPAPLVGIAAATKKLRLVLLNRSWGLDWGLVGRLRDAGQVYFDFAMLERPGALQDLVRHASPERVVFGSHFPFFYLESALLKVHEAELPPNEEQTVLWKNAGRLASRQEGSR
jgi:hypothetical protein